MKTNRKLIQTCLLCVVVLQAATSGAQPVTQIAAGDFHSLFLKSDGSLWGMGLNYHGQLGDGTHNTTNRPEQTVTSNVTAIAAGGAGSRGGAPGGSHSLLVKSDGSLWAMGYNYYGQLGDGTYNGTFHTDETNLPEQIVSSNVTTIAAGGYHSLFRQSDGSLWGMGENAFGELGDGTYNNTNLPEQIVSSNVTAVAAGGEGAAFLPFFFGSHSLFLKSDGTLWAMGYNGQGQLGDGTTNNVNLPEQIVSSNVTAIAAGGWHSLFLKSDGSLWAMGWNQYGQLGDGTTNNVNRPEQIVASHVTAIAAGWSHSLFLKSDGSLWAMGNNTYGQLGDGTYNQTNRPEQIVAGPPGFNQISIQLLSGGNVSLSFWGIAKTNYALDVSASLSPPNWQPLATNPTDAGGLLVFTNTPNPTTNSFWRIRSVP